VVAAPPVARPGLTRRLASMGYELLLMLGVLAVTLLLPHLLIGHFLHVLATPFVLWAHLFLVLAIYFAWFWTHGGQTLAMRTWRLQIVTRSGQPLRPTRALMRFLLCWPSVGIVGIGVFWALVDPEKQFLHDRLAGTRIVFRQA